MSSTRSKTSVFKDSWLSPPQNAPYVQIVEQPKQKELRFRYECEGRSAGSIPGENSTSDKKTYPTIKIANYKGSARVVVSCVTREKGTAKPRPHPHGLVGKDCENGICKKSMPKGDKPIRFENLGIQCIKKKEIVSALEDRLNRRIDPYNNFKLTTRDAKKLVTEYDLTVVCICFQVYIANEDSPDQPNVPLDPIITQPIFDKKGATMQMARVDRRSCSVKGDEELFILCDKIQKDDVKVKFYDEDGWTDYADFGPTDIHRQVAIVCKIPPYKDLQITCNVKAKFKLVRPSDGEESPPIDFLYHPEDKDPEKIGAKRKRNNQPMYNDYLQQSPTKMENQIISTCRFSKPGPTSREPPMDVREKLKRKLVARRSATLSKAPEEVFPKSTPRGERFYSSPSGNTGKVIEQEPMTTIDAAGLMSLMSSAKGLDDADVNINIGGQPINTIDESGVNIAGLNHFFNMPVSSGPLTPMSNPSPMDQEKSVLDLLGPMAQGYEANVIVEEVPGSMIQNIGSETISQETEMIEATIQQMFGANGGEVIIENFPSLATYLNESDITSMQQQIQQQEEERKMQQQQLEQQQEQQLLEQRLLEQQQQAVVGDEYIYEEVHDSLNIPVLTSIDIDFVQNIRQNGGTM